MITDLIFTFLFGILAPCVSTAATNFNGSSNAVYKFLNITGLICWLCFLASLVFLFINYTWYLPIILFLVVLFVAGFVARIFGPHIYLTGYLFWIVIIIQVICIICNISIFQL